MAIPKTANMPAPGARVFSYSTGSVGIVIETSIEHVRVRWSDGTRTWKPFYNLMILKF